MALSYQGFTLKQNLSEAEQDRTILNNLGGAPIGDDIALLFNNKRNTSTLKITTRYIPATSPYFGLWVVINDVPAIFSNRTKLTINGSTYYVKNSNGISKFQLSSKADLSDTVAPPTGDYIRSDEVTALNVSYFSALRRQADLTRVDDDTKMGYLSSSRQTTLISDEPAKTVLKDLESNIDVYRFKTSKTISRTPDENFVGRKLMYANGLVVIKDPDNKNLSGLTSSNPGLFIRDPVTGNIIRAFSSNDQPWANVGGVLTTTSKQITVGSLVFDANSDYTSPSSTTSVVIQMKAGATNLLSTVSSTGITNATFTHKIPVKINNEQYYLCLRKV